MFWQQFIALCNERNEKPNPIAKKLNIPSGSVTDWKNGRIPRATTIKKIADYFGVPVSYFYDHNQSVNSNNREALSPTDQIKKELFDRIEHMDEEQIKQLDSYVDFILERKPKS